MANKLIKRRYNNLLTARNNYFENGSEMRTMLVKDLDYSKILMGDIGNLTAPSELANSANPGKTAGVGNKGKSFSFKDYFKGALNGAVGSAVGSVGGGLIGGGLQSGAGSALSGLSSIASAIPGPAGAITSAALGIAGGLTNRMFGSKLNQENIAKVQANIDSLNSFQSNASNYDSLAENWANASRGMTFKNSFIGKDGWFSNKAKNKANELRGQISDAEDWVQNSLSNNAEAIMDTNMMNQLANYTAFGGQLMTHGSTFDTGLTHINNGGSHESNPNEGVQMGVDPEGIPNLVEEGETIFNDYVFSNRLKVPKAVRKKYKLGGPLTFADASIRMSKESEERPNDPISQLGLEDSMMKLMMAQEQVRASKEEGKKYARGGKLGRKYDGYGPYANKITIANNLKPTFSPLDTPQLSYPQDPNIVAGLSLGNDLMGNPLPSLYNRRKGIAEQLAAPVIKNLNAHLDDIMYTPRNKPKPRLSLFSPEQTWMRYVPAYASGIMSLTDALGWTNKPDYGEANAMLEASRGAGLYTPVRFNPIGDYMAYRPFDRDYYTNKLSAESGATRRALANTSGGNRASLLAGLLAAGYGALDKQGDLFRQAEEFNAKQYSDYKTFNRATKMANSDGMLKADTANQQALLNARSSYLKGALAAYDAKQKERQLATASRSANLSNFINSVGDIGRENFSRNMIVSDPSKYYSIDSNGEIRYKNAFYDLDNATQDYITGHATREVNNKGKKNHAANGGYLTIKKKRK